MSKTKCFKDQHCETQFRLMAAAIGLVSLILFNAFGIEIQGNWIAGYSLILAAAGAANVMNYRTKKKAETKEAIK